MKRIGPYIVVLIAGLWWAAQVAKAQASAPGASSAPTARAIGEVTQVQADRLTVHTDKGDVQVELPDGVRILRGVAGSKELTPITPNEISVGDRAAVLGHLKEDGQTVQAVRVLLTTKADVTKIHEAELREWQTRGIEGNVKEVDPAKNAITILVPNRPPTPGNLTHPVVLTLTPKTTILRYAQDSVKFADAKPSSLAAVKAGDQLRALGTKNEDGTQYAAEKVVFGTFQNIGAMVISVDPQAKTLTVKNLATGKPLVVHANQDCKIHQLPMGIANMIARLSSGDQGGGPGRGGARPSGPDSGPAGPGGGGSPRGGGMGRGGVGNLSQQLENMPTLTLNDFKRGEPVVIFSMQGTTPSEVTAIFILTGVEPILAAQPKGGGEMNLGSWNLSLGGGGGEGEQ